MPGQPSYSVEIRESAAKEIRTLPSDVKQRVIKAIDALATEPHPRGGDNLYRIRVGVFRIVYTVNDAARLLIVTRARHRREVYD